MAKPWDPSKQLNLEAAQRLDPRAELYQVNPDVAVELLNLQQEYGGSYTSTESVFAALPSAPSVGEFAKTGAFAEARSLFFDDAVRASQFGYDITTGQYFVQGGQLYENLADDPRDHLEEPAPITVKPTSTTNPRKPRTIAAGYRAGTSLDRKSGTLTVIFRDGTYYNYYEVEPYMWQRFKAVKSKGKFIRKYLDSYPRGYAEIAYISDLAQRAEYFISRTNQLLNKGNQGMRPRQQPSLQRRLLESQRSARRSARLAKTAGTNPAKSGRPRRP